MIGLCTKRNAIVVPMTIDNASAVNVTRSVTISECNSAGAFSTKVFAIKLGVGTRYEGTVKTWQHASQPATIRTPTTTGGKTSASFFFVVKSDIAPADLSLLLVRRNLQVFHELCREGLGPIGVFGQQI